MNVSPMFPVRRMNYLYVRMMSVLTSSGSACKEAPDWDWMAFVSAYTIGGRTGSCVQLGRSLKHHSKLQTATS